jgi:hypothetical protein
MKFEVLYETKSDFHQKFWNNDFQTLLSLKSQGKVEIVETEKGLLLVHFKGLKSKALISPKNKVQVFYASEKEKSKVQSAFEGILGESLERSAKKITCFSVDWPPPENFKLSACKEAYLYHMQPLMQKLHFQKGVPPLLWILLFAVLSLPLLPQFL